jgi:hypothetical protein
MQQEKLTEFSGVAGRVLQQSVSSASLITGIVLGFSLIVGNWVLVMIRAPEATVPFNQIVLALALARFAVNGLFGEWSGTLFSCSGGSWFHAGAVAVRYLALTALWLVPLMLLGSMPEQAMMGPAMFSDKVMIFLLFYMLLMTLTPPLFLIVSVSAQNFADLFSVYVVYTGTLGMVLALSLPLLVAGFAVHKNIGFLIVGLTFCLLLGMSVNLLGRLCGFFACGELHVSQPAATVAMTPPSTPVGTGPVQSRPVVAPPATMTGPPAASAAAAPSPTPSVTTAPEPITAVPAPPAGTLPEPTTGAAAPSAAVASPPTPSVATGTEPTTTAHVPPPVASAAPTPSAAEPAMLPAVAPPSAGVEPAGMTQPIPRVPLEAPPVEPATPGQGERRAPLMEAQQKVEAALQRFPQDPDGAISALEDLNESFAPHPHVLEALAVCLHRRGRIEEALGVARRALPLCFERGHSYFAAEIFREMRQHMAELKLNREQVLTVAAALAKQDDLSGAAKAYSNVIAGDAGEGRAIKGLLQIADRLLNEKSNPDAAVKVYRYLMQHCAASPLVEFIRDGLEQAERKLQRVSV